MMTTGADKHLVGSPLPAALKREFRDAHDRRAYLRARLLCARLLEEPALLDRGRAFLDRFVKSDPRQRRIYAMWNQALALPLDQLVRELLSDTARGAALRETAPVFVVIPADEIRALDQSAA